MPASGDIDWVMLSEKLKPCYKTLWVPQHMATRKAIVENQKLRHKGHLFQHGFAYHVSQFSAVLLFTW